MANVVEVYPLTRVEGHGSVTVRLAGLQVEGVELHLSESPRLFEALLTGKDYREIPEIICRICSICSTVHRVVALQAIENAFAVEVPETVRRYRELAVCGGLIESHALHLYCLVLPDRHGVVDLAGLVRQAPTELARGLRLKAAGNLVQETVGGRLIHPVNLLLGGIGRAPDRERLEQLGERLAAVQDDARETVRLFSVHSPADLAVPLAQPYYLAARPCPDNLLETADGSRVASHAYRKMVAEWIVAHSNAKMVTVAGRHATVGALARLNLGSDLSPGGAQAFFDARAALVGADVRANSLAQAVELVHGVERALSLVKALLASGNDPVAPVRVTPRQGRGTAAIEAPRGTLIHSYNFDGQGRCTAADVVTPTAINQAAMARDLATVATALVDRPEEVLRFGLEQLVRLYDPCISCAVHLVWQ